MIALRKTDAFPFAYILKEERLSQKEWMMMDKGLCTAEREVMMMERKKVLMKVKLEAQEKPKSLNEIEKDWKGCNCCLRCWSLCFRYIDICCRLWSTRLSLFPYIYYITRTNGRVPSARKQPI